MKICPTCRAEIAEEEERCPHCGAGRESTLDGKTLVGKYRILGVLGGGAMGRVYRAKHLGLDTEVAIKLLRPEVALDPDSAARFRHEARATSRLRHPNIINILDFGHTETGQLYLVTELLHGKTLTTILREDGPLQPRRVGQLCGQAFAALDEAHAAGVIHRDFKPDNIIVTPTRAGEQVKVLDFGLAQVGGDRTEGKSTTLGSSTGTPSGSVCGTPDYMSPEQIRGEALDGRADVYAAGVVLYELLTGVRPFSGDLLAILTGHLHHPPRPPLLLKPRPGITPALEAVIFKALAKRREDRYGTAGELRLALDVALGEGTPTRCSGCGEGVAAGVRACPVCGAAMSERTVPAVGEGFELPLLFSGRSRELSRLCTLERGAVRVVGPGGSGRTQLVAEWRRWLEARGGRVLTLLPDPSGARRAWRPVRRAVAATLAVSESPSLAELEQGCWNRQTDVAGLCEVFGLERTWGETPRSPAEAELVPRVSELALRRREALAAATGVLRDAGMSLLCEDVDRYDPLSAEVVARLLADPGTTRVVATTTQSAADARVTAEEIALRPLEPAALQRVGAAGLNLPGWPLTIEQALRGRAEGVAASGGPEGMVKGRLAVLPPGARRAMAAAVVLGMDVEVEVLRRVVAISGGGELDAGALATLAGRGLVRLTPGGAPIRVSLPSPTARDSFYAALEAAERSGLHQAAGEALAGARNDSELLAHHAWQGAPATTPVELLEQAARSAERNLDMAGAARWYQRTLVRTSRNDQPAMIRLTNALGWARLLAGDATAAEASFQEVLAMSPPSQSAADARRGLGRLAMEKGDAPRALDVLEQAMGLTEGRQRAEICLELAEVHSGAGRIVDAERALRRSVAMAPTVPEVAWRLLVALAEVCHKAGRIDQAVRLGEQALVAAAGRSAGGRARAHTLLADIHHQQREPDMAIAHRRAALDELRARGDRRGQAEQLLVAAGSEAPDPVSARRWLAEAGELARQIDWREGEDQAREALRKLA